MLFKSITVPNRKQRRFAARVLIQIEVKMKLTAQTYLFFLAIFLLLSLVPSDDLAQTAAVAELDGTALDTTGAIISGATVIATNADTGAVRTTTTNAAGTFTMPALAVGPYSVEVRAKGFKSFQQTGIILQVGSSSMIKTVLDVGSSSDTITIQSDAQMIETRNVAISTVIDNREINDLPLDGRLATQLVLIAGASVGVSGGDLTGSKQFSSSQAISVAGSQGNSLNFNLDGSDHNDPFSNVNLPFPFPDALREFSVSTNALPAEYGVHPGGVVKAVTLSGTNRFHGTLFEYLRNDKFNALGHFSVKDTLHRNQYGGTIGGPHSPRSSFLLRRLSGNTQCVASCSHSGQSAYPGNDQRRLVCL